MSRPWSPGFPGQLSAAQTPSLQPRPHLQLRLLAGLSPLGVQSVSLLCTLLTTLEYVSFPRRRAVPLGTCVCVLSDRHLIGVSVCQRKAWREGQRGGKQGRTWVLAFRMQPCYPPIIGRRHQTHVSTHRPAGASSQVSALDPLPSGAFFSPSSLPCRQLLNSPTRKDLLGSRVQRHKHLRILMSPRASHAGAPPPQNTSLALFRPRHPPDTGHLPPLHASLLLILFTLG